MLLVRNDRKLKLLINGEVVGEKSLTGNSFISFEPLIMGGLGG